MTMPNRYPVLLLMGLLREMPIVAPEIAVS